MIKRKYILYLNVGFCLQFSRVFSATFKACSLISANVISISGSSSFNVIPRHPEPVPISRVLSPAVKWQFFAISINASLSGRGINTSGVTIKLRP